MTELKNLGVQELAQSEATTVSGGSDFSYAAAYTMRLMVSNPMQAVQNALDFYAGRY